MKVRWQQWPKRRGGADTCERKRRYLTWDDAEAAALAVWREAPRERYTNPPSPYICDLQGEQHYHIGH